MYQDKELMAKFLNRTDDYNDVKVRLDSSMILNQFCVYFFTIINVIFFLLPNETFQYLII